MIRRKLELSHPYRYGFRMTSRFQETTLNLEDKVRRTNFKVSKPKDNLYQQDNGATI